MPKITKTKRGFNIQHTTRDIWGVDDSSEMPTPKINDKFRFDDGTIGTITNKTWHGNKAEPIPVIEVNSRKFGYSTFAIASIECYSHSAGTINYWRVIEDAQ